MDAVDAAATSLRQRLDSLCPPLPPSESSDVSAFALTALTDPRPAGALYSSRVLRMDAGRTRQDVPAFRSPLVVDRVERLLAAFCRGGGAAWLPARRYRQGLNELLGPLLALNGELVSDAVLLHQLSVLVGLFAARTYCPAGDADDPDCVAVQCSLRLFRLSL